MNLKTPTKLLVAALLVAGGARAHADPAEESYVRSAQAINQAELALGQLGQRRGSSEEVKQMSRTMVERHSALTAQLAALARERAIATEREPSREDQQVQDRLVGLSGRAFDVTFKQAVADAHARELALHRGELERSGDAALRGYARSRVTALEASMAQAKEDW